MISAAAAIYAQALRMRHAGRPYMMVADWVCPEGNEKPVASSRAEGTGLTSGSRTQGRGIMNIAFKNWFTTLPAMKTSMNL